MKLKEQKKFGILWLSIGAALFLAGLLLGETEYGSYIGGFGGGLTAPKRRCRTSRSATSCW